MSSNIEIKWSHQSETTECPSCGNLIDTATGYNLFIKDKQICQSCSAKHEDLLRTIDRMSFRDEQGACASWVWPNCLANNFSQVRFLSPPFYEAETGEKDDSQRGY